MLPVWFEVIWNDVIVFKLVSTSQKIEYKIQLAMLPKYVSVIIIMINYFVIVNNLACLSELLEACKHFLFCFRLI